MRTQQRKGLCRPPPATISAPYTNESFSSRPWAPAVSKAVMWGGLPWGSVMLVCHQVVGDEAAAPPVATDEATVSPVVADEAAAHPGIPGLIRKLEDPSMRSVRAAGIPRLAPPKAAVPVPEPAPVLSLHSPLQSPLRSVSPRSLLQSPLHSMSPWSLLRSVSLRSPLQSPLRSRSPQSPLHSMSPWSLLRSVSLRSPLQSPLREPTEPLRSGSPQSPLRSGSPQSPLWSGTPHIHSRNRSGTGAQRIHSKKTLLSRLSAPPWWHPALLALPWPPALPVPPRHPCLPIPPGPLPLHGPGPPSLPQIRFRPNPLLEIVLFVCGASGIRSLREGLCHGPAGDPYFMLTWLKLEYTLWSIRLIFLLRHYLQV